MKKWILALTFGLAVTALGFSRVLREESAFAVSIGMAMCVISLLKMRKGEQVTDERDIKIARASMSYSWTFTYILIATMVLIDHFRLIELRLQAALGIIFFSMVAVQMLSRIYLQRAEL